MNEWMPVCLIQRIVQRSRVFLCLKLYHPPPPYKPSYVIHVFSVQKFQVSFLSVCGSSFTLHYVCVCFFLLLPFFPQFFFLSVSFATMCFDCFFVFSFSIFRHHFTLYRLPKSHCHYYILWSRNSHWNGTRMVYLCVSSSHTHLLHSHTYI